MFSFGKRAAGTDHNLVPLLRLVARIVHLEARSLLEVLLVLRVLYEAGNGNDGRILHFVGHHGAAEGFLVFYFGGSHIVIFGRHELRLQ